MRNDCRGNYSYGGAVMTPTEREWGKLQEQLETVIHRSRNDRQLILGLDERLDQLDVAIARLRAAIHASVVIVLVLSGLVAWLVDVAISMKV